MSPEMKERLEAIEKDLKDVVCAYLRCSTCDQSVEQQKDLVYQYAKNNNFNVKWIFADDGVSGSRRDRPELNKMLELVRAGKCKIIIVRQMSRLGRSFEHIADLCQEFRRRGIRLISINDHIDTIDDSPYTRAYLRLMATFAELQREMIVQNTNDRLSLYKKQIKEQGFFTTKEGVKKTSLGRPKGKKDSAGVRRKKSGYLLRWQKEIAH